MSDWQPWYNEQQRQQRHYERYGTTEVPERQYRRRVGQNTSTNTGLFILYVIGGAVGTILSAYGAYRLWQDMHR